MRAKNKSDVLLVGTDPALESRLRSGLSAANYRVTTAAAAEDVLAKAARQEIDVLVSQVCAEGLSGLELLHELSPIHPKLPVILLANQPSAQTTIEAAKLGAFQLLSKPFDFFELLQTIRRAALSNREALPALTPGEAEFGQTGLIGTSHVMRELYYRIASKRLLPGVGEKG
jgi:two-component system response regulator AtoC